MALERLSCSQGAAAGSLLPVVGLGLQSQCLGFLCLLLLVQCLELRLLQLELLALRPFLERRSRGMLLLLLLLVQCLELALRHLCFRDPGLSTSHSTIRPYAYYYQTTDCYVKCYGASRHTQATSKALRQQDILRLLARRAVRNTTSKDTTIRALALLHNAVRQLLCFSLVRQIQAA